MLCATRAHGGRPPAHTASAGGAAGARKGAGQRVQRLPARAHGACATSMQRPTQGVQRARNARRNMRAGCVHDHAIPAAICAQRVRTPCATGERQRATVGVADPGSDQFHEEIGTSTVGDFGLLIRSTIGIPIPLPVCNKKTRRRFHGRNLLTGTVGTRFPTATAAAGGDGGGGGEERKEKYKLKSFWLRSRWVLGTMARFMMVLGLDRGGPWWEEMVARRYGRAIKHALRKGDRSDPVVVLSVGRRPVVAGGGCAKE
ncbi:squamosa promoter-binding-like protein 5-like [Dorcoceras hygrometricum]|uniref:Squamosa promoter-binding-like protein 5-like n=1 Tax=Dorcoceras hygrometricum TaxID=472368 RepID=A0A2Z7A716_9LAMI|nr:squamosa promoter-binding-like protein 5-like [Dorcoceras hygrometricum]